MCIFITYGLNAIIIVLLDLSVELSINWLYKQDSWLSTADLIRIRKCRRCYDCSRPLSLAGDDGWTRRRSVGVAIKTRTRPWPSPTGIPGNRFTIEHATVPSSTQVCSISGRTKSAPRPFARSANVSACTYSVY